MFFHNILRKMLVWRRYIRRPDFSAQTVLTHPTPEEIKSGQIIVVGDVQYQKWACFRCPGGCGESILLSLNQKRHPSWKITIDWLGRPTLYPSIRQLNDCQCHFWIRQGMIEWCADSGKK